ncbi:hypothetical protein BJX76DRAFT_362701 [Aspergillus varians]
MSQGNAWAQMRAREQMADPDRGKYSPSFSLRISHSANRVTGIKLANWIQELTPKPTIPRESSGLDYDAELALPMPKPRHARLEDTSSPIIKSGRLSKPKITKKTSTAELSLSTESNSKSEKKKSKVATLRSKFSLKDIGKEFRKEIPPLCSMPKLGGGSGNETKHASSDARDQSKPSPNFDEVRFYVPKASKVDVHPNSAPAHLSEFHHHTSDSHHCASLSPTFKHSVVHSADAGQGTKNMRLENLSLNSSSPPARSSECNYTGQPELIQVQDRVPIMKAENSHVVVSSTPRTLPLSIDVAAYTPSIYDSPKTVIKEASVSSLHMRVTQTEEHPFIVSSSDYNEKAHKKQAEGQLFMSPREPPVPPLLPNKSRARDEVRNNQSNIAIGEGQQYIAGVTSHGGYDPHPGYQGMVNLDQQLASHVDWLHLHVDTAINGLTSTVEQNTKNMYDRFRVIDTRAANHQDFIQHLQKLLSEIHHQLKMTQQEALSAEERMKAFVQQEVTKLKKELSELILPNAGVASSQVQAQDSKSDTSLSGGQGGSRPAKDGEKRSQNQNKKKSKPVQMKRDDLASNKAADNKNSVAEHNQEIKHAPVQQAEANPGKEPDDQGLGDSVPMPTTAFRAPKPQTNRAASPVLTHQEVSESPREETFGSPKLKAGKLRISSPKPITNLQPAGESIKGLGDNPPPSLQRESVYQPRSAFSSDDLKAPKKRGGMLSGFRRKGNGDNHSGNRLFRAPRCTKEGKTASSREIHPRLGRSAHTQAPVTTVTSSSASSITSSNATLATGAGGQIHREGSPSLTHPAVRTPQQKQIMADRERRLVQLNCGIQRPEYGRGQEYGQSFPFSQSFHNFGSTSHSSLATYNAPNPGYASGMIFPNSSSSSFRGVSHYQSSIHNSHRSATPPLPFQGREVGQPQYFAPHPIPPHSTLPDIGHGDGHGQSDGFEWYGDGNGSMADEAVHPKGDFF